MNNYETFKVKYGPLISDPYASCIEDEHWESIHRAKVAACGMGMVTPSPFLKVWATDEVDGVWSIRPLCSPDEFDENPIGTFWVTTKPRDVECKETYIWVEGQKMSNYKNTDKEKTVKVTAAQVEYWLGSDWKLSEIIETLMDLANGDYKQEQLREDIEDTWPYGANK